MSFLTVQDFTTALTNIQGNLTLRDEEGRAITTISKDTEYGSAVLTTDPNQRELGTHDILSHLEGMNFNHTDDLRAGELGAPLTSARLATGLHYNFEENCLTLTQER